MVQLSPSLISVVIYERIMMVKLSYHRAIIDLL